MALKPVLDSLDGIAEPLKAEYTKHDDGKFYLSLDGAPAGFVPRTKHDEFAQTNTKLMRQIEEAQALAKKYEGIDAEQARAALKRVQELEGKKLRDEGEFDKALKHETDRMQREFEQQLQAQKERADKAETGFSSMRKALGRRTIEDEVVSAAAKLGIKPKCISDVKRAVHEVFRYEIEDGAETGKIVAYEADGKTPIYLKGERPTIEAWITAQKNDTDWFVPSKGAGASGSEGQASHAGGTNGVRPWQAHVAGVNLKDIASGKIRYEKEEAEA